MLLFLNTIFITFPLTKRMSVQTCPVGDSELGLLQVPAAVSIGVRAAQRAAESPGEPAWLFHRHLLSAMVLLCLPPVRKRCLFPRNTSHRCHRTRERSRWRWERASPRLADRSVLLPRVPPFPRRAIPAPGASRDRGVPAAHPVRALP